MAGLYADVPGVRIPYHVDGSRVAWANTVGSSNKALSTGWTDYSGAEIAEINDGDTTDVIMWPSDNAGDRGRYILWLFPQPVTITGHNFIGGTAQWGLMEYSTTTTDGSDGTWNTAPSDVLGTVGSGFRSITAVNWPSVKAIRLHMFQSYTSYTYPMKDAAFYGTWTPATLTGWHPTLNQQIGGAHFDYGDIALGASDTRQFRIKNGRALQANNVVVSVAAGNTQTAGGMQVSLDNTTYSTSVNIASIAAAAISPVIYVRRIVGMAETIGNVGIASVQFIATTWT